MIYVMLILMISLLLTCFIFMLGKYLKMKINQDLDMSSPFECGFTPFSLNFKIFSLRFFMLGIIFLIFDLELVILYPFYLSLFKGFNLYSQLIFITFIMILTWGFYYEWNELKINWLK